jgi:hypothetical protein
MTRDELVLAALAAAGENATFRPVQVQKLFFLIDREAAALVDGPHFAFRPYDYGPFDSDVYDVLAKFEREGLAQSTSPNRYRIYALSERGFQAGVRVLRALPPLTQNYLQQIAAWTTSLSFPQLVAAIYKKYPDMKVNSIFRG